MVFWCGGGLFSAPDSLTGRGWDRFFLYSFRRDVRVFWCDFVACPYFTAIVFWLAASPSFTAMVFWCGGRLFSAPDSVQREKVGKRLLFDFVACPSITAMVFWCSRGLFSAPESIQREKVGKK